MGPQLNEQEDDGIDTVTASFVASAWAGSDDEATETRSVISEGGTTPFGTTTTQRRAFHPPP